MHGEVGRWNLKVLMLFFRMLCVPPCKMKLLAKASLSVAEDILVLKEDRVAIVSQRVTDGSWGHGGEA